MFLKKKTAASYVIPPSDDFLRQHRGTPNRYPSTLASNVSNSLPWTDSNGLTSENNRAYIPLREVDRSSDRYTKVTGGHTHHRDWDPDESTDVEGYARPNAIMKTIRVESTLNRR